MLTALLGRLRYVKRTGTASPGTMCRTCPEGGEQQLRWGHAFIETTAFFRLIARDTMAARRDLKLNRAKILYCDFHSGTLLSSHTVPLMSQNPRARLRAVNPHGAREACLLRHQVRGP